MAERSRHELSRADVHDLLVELGRRLDGEGIEATLYIVGGAAMAMEFDVRRVTRDVDAIFHPRAAVLAHAQAMAEERELPDNWLNDNVRAFVPGDDSQAVPFSVPGLSVALASPRHLLAMKMAAFRPADKPDLEVLFRELSITRAEDAADLAIEVYGEHSVVLPSRSELILESESILARLAARRQT